MNKKQVTNDGRKGGWLVGKRHYDKNGNPLGGIKAIVTDAGGRPVELEGGEVIINREASKKHWKELSRINQSAGNGVPINPPADAFDEDPENNYENGGKIEFNANHIPNKWILSYAEKIKSKHPEIWKLGGNIFGNEAFENLKRVAKRGYWLDSEEWMYIKWRSYVARHQRDYRIEGVVAMLKWVDKVFKGWPYMKQLIEEKIDKIESKKGWKHKTSKMAQGGKVDIKKLEALPKGSLFEDSKKIDGIFKKSKHTWSEVIETFENNKNKATSQIVDLKEINITQPNIQTHKIKDMLQNFDKLPLINVVEFKDGLVIYDGHHRLITAWLLGKDKIKVNLVKVNLNEKMAQGGDIITYKNKYNKKYGYKKDKSHSLEEISKDTGVSIKGLQQIYDKGIGAYKTNPESVRPNVKSKEQWAMARVYSAVMGGDAAIVDKNELKMVDGGNVIKSNCIEYIKNSEAIKNNGHYLDFKNLNIYVESGNKVIPKEIQSLFLITYNSGGQKNLKSIDTINSVELANKLAKLLNIELGIAKIIVSEQVIHSKRFEMDLINKIVDKNIVIIDRDTIVCENISNKFAQGGLMSSQPPTENQLWNQLVKHYDKGGLIAPNGKPSNLTPEQYKLVRTKAFKDWFGDWENNPENASKVVDENGEPLPVYHGTDAEFWKFDKSKGKGKIKQKSINFSSNKEVSKDYGNRILECFLNIRNPYIKNYHSESYHAIEFNARKEWKFDEIPDVIVNKTFDEKIYDGVIFLNIKDSKSRFSQNVPVANNYYAFNNKQIKLADGTNNTFDGNNPDIRYAGGGEIKDITCKSCNWSWDKNESEKHDLYICHKCGTDNKIKEGGELAMGIKAEHEHSKTISKFKKPGVSDLDVEKAIAKDHLKEDPHYYSKLAKMENKFDKGGTVTVNGVEYKVGDTGTYGSRDREKITITSISPKIVSYITSDGKKKGVYTYKFENYFYGDKSKSETQSQVIQPQENIDEKIKRAVEIFSKNGRLILDLPPYLKYLAKLNQLKQGNKENDNLRLIESFDEGNFRWAESNEGMKFWIYIQEGDWTNPVVLNIVGSKEKLFELPKSTSSQQTQSQVTQPQENAFTIQNIVSKTQWSDDLKKSMIKDFVNSGYEDVTQLIGENKEETSSAIQKKVDGFASEKNTYLQANTLAKEIHNIIDLITSKTKHELSNYRIKTEKEFIDEYDRYGQDWREFLTTWKPGMDWMFGKPITELVYKKDYDSVMKSIKLGVRAFLTKPETGINEGTWNITSNFVKYDISTGMDFSELFPKKEETKIIHKEVSEVKSERELLTDEYNDVLFLIENTLGTDTENMLSLKSRAKELKDKIDTLDLEIKKKNEGEINLLDELFSSSTIQPQARYDLKAYSDGFAPDGQPTSLPKNIYDWTNTEEFQNWFGNFTLAYNYRNSSYENVPCSVVVNKNHEPLIVYHGTGGQFSFFKFDKFPAMYFAENEAYSNWFAEMKGKEQGNKGYIYPFFLNIRTPLDLTYFEINDVSPSDFIDWMYLQTGLDADELKINKALTDPTKKFKAWMYLRNSPEMLKVLRDKNIFDGIIYYEDNPSVDKNSDAYKTKAYIIFNSNSAKIAEPNRHKLTIPAMRSFYLKRGGKI